MSLVIESHLRDIFNKLNESGLNYILLRNLNDELPSKLKVGKDIDILIKKRDEKEIKKFFFKYNFSEILHPHINNTYLYGVDKFEFIYNSKTEVLFDLNFQIAVRSLDAGQWIPLDQEIQNSAWENRTFYKDENNFSYWKLSYEDEFICILARAIFDKESMDKGYRKRISQLFNIIEKDKVVNKLEKIFFKFTPYLIKYIENNQYDEIKKNYINFKEY